MTETEKFRQRDNAVRLAYVLRDYAADQRIVQQLASILHYNPQQLTKDMQDISKYISRLEEEKD